MMERVFYVVSDAVMVILFFVMIIQMLFCALIGKKSWLEQSEENLSGGRNE